MRLRTIAGAVTGIVVFTVLAALAAVFVATNTDWGRGQVRTRVLSALQSSVRGQVAIGELQGNLLQGITLNDVRIADSSGSPFLTARRISTGYALRGLLGKRLELSDVELDSATIVLDRSADGRWNYERIFPSDTTTPVDTTSGFGDWIVLRDVHLRDSRLLVHTPWVPDSTLPPAARDSSIRSALAGEGRVAVSRRSDGTYRQTQDFRRIQASLPLVRIADPDVPTKLVRADSLSMEAFAFAPPAASVRQLGGEFELDGDSLWFREVAVALPASNATLTGRYEFVRGDLRLRAFASPVALGDIQFLYPPLPDSGAARGTLDLVWENGTQRYQVQQLDLVSGSTRINGDVDLTLGDSAGGLTFGPTNLDIVSLHTALVERMVPGVDIPRAGVIAGRAAMSGTMHALQLDSDISFTDEKSGRSRIVAVGELGAADGLVRADGLRVTLAPLQIDLARAFAPDLPIRGRVTGSATLDGESDALLRATRVDLVHVAPGERSHVTGHAAVRNGDSPSARWLDARLVAQPVSLGTIGRFAPAAELRGRVSGPVQVTGPWNALSVDAQLRTSDGGMLAARGTFDLASRDLGYALDLRSELLDLNAVSGKAPHTSLSAFIQTRARGTTPNSVRGSFAADVRASRIDTVALDSLRLRARVERGVLRLDDTWLRGAGTLVTVAGTFGVADGTSGTAQWRATVDSLALLRRYFPATDTTSVPPRPLRTAERLAAAQRDSIARARELSLARMVGEAPPAVPVRVDSAPTLRRDSLAGSLDARGEVRGGLQRASLAGVLDALHVVALGNSVRQAHATFEVTDLLAEATRYRVKLSADSLLASGFALDSVSARVEHAAPGGTAEVSVYQNEARDYGAKATYALYPDRREVLWNSLRLRFDSTLWQSAYPGALRWGQPGIFVDSLDLRNGASGRVFANGLVPNEGAVDLRLLVNDFQLGDVMGLLQSDLDARGRINVDGRISGTGRAPQLTGEARLDDARYRDTPVPSVVTTFTYANHGLEVRAQLRDSARGPRTVATANASLPIDLAFFDVEGSRLLDLPARADLVADSLPLDLVGRVTTALQDVRGAASGRATLRGTLKEPVLTGSLALTDGRAFVSDLGITADRVNGHVTLANDTVRLDSLVAWTDGRLALRGSADISTPSKPVVTLTFAADRARVLDNEQGRVRVDADITARGPLDGIAVQGRTRIREGVLYIPQSDEREVISSGDPSVFAVIDTTDVRTRELVPAQSPLLSNLRLDLSLAVDRDTWVRSRDANIEIYSDGDLNIQVDRRRSALTLDGVVNTDRGEYQLLGKRFQIKRGAVQFVGTQEINPLLQITGEYEVKQAARPALNINILIGGTLHSPRLTLESDAQPPISQTDLLSYLAFGSESGSLMQFGSSSLSGGSAGGNLVGTSAALATRQLTGVALGVAVEELEGQAARSLGADVLNITPANVPPELASGNFGALSTFLRGTRFEFGKYVNTRTFVGLQLQATTTPGFRVERQLGRTPGLSLESTFQPRFFLPEPSLSEQEITKANAFGLFLRKRWRF